MMPQVQKVLPEVISDAFVDDYINLLHESDIDLKALSLDYLGTIVSLTTNEAIVSKLFNNAKSVIATTAVKEVKYDIMNSFLKASPYCTKEFCISVILKPLLVFLREHQECFDVYFVKNFSLFAVKCGYEALSESIDPFFRSITIHYSQTVF